MSSLRVVLDTSVMVAALRSRSGASNLLLRLIAGEKLIPLASPPLFLEYEDVLLRPEHRLVHGFSEDRVRDFLATFAGWIEPVAVHFRWRPQLSDPKDEMVLEAAVNGRADALVTHNVKDFASAATRFGLSVLTPQQVLEEMR